MTLEPDWDDVFSAKENKGPDVKARKAKARKEKQKEKDNVRSEKYYRFLKDNHPDRLQIQECAKRIKCLEDEDYGQKVLQQKRKISAKSRGASKKLAINSGTRGIRLPGSRHFGQKPLQCL